MITVQEVKDFLNTPDFPDTMVQNAITLAQNRAKKLLNLADTDPLPDTPEVRKALILLASSEIATQTNLYWKKGDNYEVINVRNLISEVEKLLKAAPDKVGVKWMALEK